MFVLSKHLLVELWFDGIKQSPAERCLGAFARILDRWMTSGLTENFILASILEVCKQLTVKADGCFCRNLCLQCLVGSECSSGIYEGAPLLPKVSNGTISNNCCHWLVSFLGLFITEFQQVVVWRIEIIRTINLMYNSQILQLNINITILKLTTHDNYV